MRAKPKQMGWGGLSGLGGRTEGCLPGNYSAGLRLADNTPGTQKIDPSACPFAAPGRYIYSAFISVAISESLRWLALSSE